MVQAMINISKDANQILNIVKAKYNLKDKSQAIELVVKDYGERLLEPELKPEFVSKMLNKKNEALIEISDFKKHFKIKDV